LLSIAVIEKQKNTRPNAPYRKLINELFKTIFDGIEQNTGYHRPGISSSYPEAPYFNIVPVQSFPYQGEIIVKVSIFLDHGTNRISVDLISLLGGFEGINPYTTKHFYNTKDVIHHLNSLVSPDSFDGSDILDFDSE
jgi:hypothetical protein